MATNKKCKWRKLEQLRKIEGFGSVQDMLARFAGSATMPGICVNPACDMTELSLEPDGSCRCEECGGSIESVMLLADAI